MKWIVFIGNIDGASWEQDYVIRDSEEEAITEALHLAGAYPVRVFQETKFFELEKEP